MQVQDFQVYWGNREGLTSFDQTVNRNITQPVMPDSHMKSPGGQTLSIFISIHVSNGQHVNIF